MPANRAWCFPLSPLSAVMLIQQLVMLAALLPRRKRPPSFRSASFRRILCFLSLKSRHRASSAAPSSLRFCRSSSAFKLPHLPPRMTTGGFMAARALPVTRRHMCPAWTHYAMHVLITVLISAPSTAATTGGLVGTKTTSLAMKRFIR